MRDRFDRQLQELSTTLIAMGLLVEKSITLTMEALDSGVDELLREIRHLDREIDAKESEIEALCLRLILQQQPVAKDLRTITSALKMITDLERIGDQCFDVVEIATKHRTKDFEKSHLYQMGLVTKSMVSKSISSYVNHNEKLAHQVIQEDDRVDALFLTIRGEVKALLSTNEESAIDMLMIGKYFERIGDHAVNVAEWALFTITGEHKDHQIM